MAAVALVATLQFTFRARQFAVTPSELLAWWPDAMQPERARELEHEQQAHRAAFKVWANRARYAYDVGIVAFAFAITVALVPPGDIRTGRVITITVAVIASCGELAWIAEDVMPRRRRA